MSPHHVAPSAMLALSAALLLMLACTEEVFEPPDQGPCAQDFECPTGYSCLDLRCIRDAADAGADVGMDAGADAAADADGPSAAGQTRQALGASCADIARCVSACDGARCVQTCVQSGALEPQRKFASVVQCVEAACVGLDGNALSECQLRACSTPLEACFARPTGLGGESCDTVFRCVAGCDSAICADACVAAGTFEAQRAAVALYECALPACAVIRDADAYAACAAAACASPATRCGL